jgi:hypothetical protein
LLTTGDLASISVVIGLISMVAFLVLFLCDPNAGKTVREPGEGTISELDVISSFNALLDSGLVGPSGI